MNIGERLKKLRIEAGLTQEAVVDTIGVTRQTLSSWENNKSLPDARGIALLGELYGVSVESMVREDTEMTNDVHEQRVMVARRKRLYQCLQIGLFVLLWVLMIALFWIGGNAMHVLFSLVIASILIPLMTIVFGALLGADEMWKWGKWVFVLFGGAANALWYSVTYGLANSNDKSFWQWLEYTYEPEMFCIGVGLATVGIVFGIVLKYIKRAAVKKLVR